MGWLGSLVCFMAGALFVIAVVGVLMHADGGLSWPLAGAASTLILSLFLFVATAVRAEQDANSEDLTPKQAAKLAKVLQERGLV